MIKMDFDLSVCGELLGTLVNFEDNVGRSCIVHMWNSGKLLKTIELRDIVGT